LVKSVTGTDLFDASQISRQSGVEPLLSKPSDILSVTAFGLDVVGECGLQFRTHSNRKPRLFVTMSRRMGMKLDDDARRVLQITAHGRSNRHHICQQSGLAEAEVIEHIATLTAAGLVTEVDRDLFTITSDGLDELTREYPTEAGFLQETSVIHDAPMIKTLRLRGERGLVEVQVDGQSVLKLAEAIQNVLADTHDTHDAVVALEDLVGSDVCGETADEV
jgi:hypothetical protein